jgi:hypothetical protein
MYRSTPSLPVHYLEVSGLLSGDLLVPLCNLLYGNKYIFKFMNTEKYINLATS